MTAIALGYTAHGRSAAPTSLYVGGDAAAARAAFENPPAGIVRTELIIHPCVTRRRVFDTAPPAEPAPEPAAPADTPPADTPPAETDPPEETALVETPPEEKATPRKNK